MPHDTSYDNEIAMLRSRIKECARHKYSGPNRDPNIQTTEVRINIINTAAWLQHNGHKDLAEQLVSILEGE